MKMICALSLVITCAHVLGCVSTPTPKIPQEFELSCSNIVKDVAPTIIEIDGPTDKVTGAASGAAVCGGEAFALTTPACVISGPLFPICFMVVVLPATTLSAGTCAAIGAIFSENSEDVDAKRSMLADALTSLEPDQQLVPLLQQKLIEAFSTGTLPSNNEPKTTDTGCQIRIAKTKFSTFGFGINKPFFLRVSADLEILRGDDQEPIFVKSYQLTSASKMSMDEWRVNNDEPVRTTLRDLLVGISSEMSSYVMLSKKRQ